MLSSIISFLPSLHLNSNSSNSQPTTPVFNPTDTRDEEEAYKQPSEEDSSIKKGANKTKTANETFIFVRPPPAKSNHPLNLQVQLVPPTARNQRQSLDEPDTSVTLARTPSNRSDTSSYGSTASFSSTTSTASGRRTIIPLYNLQAHNVMTNTIVDAGTDARIARFQRRGIELIDLAILEPVEVWGEKPGAVRTSRPATPDPSTTNPSATTAGSSTASFSSGSHSQPTLTPVVQQPLPSSSSSKRNIFGKMFKKGKDARDTTPPASPITPGLTPTPNSNTTPTPSNPTPGRISARRHVRNLSATLSPTGNLGSRNRSSSPNPQLLSLQVPTQEEANAITSDVASANLEEKILRPPVLGIQPTLSFSYAPSATGGLTPAPIPTTSLAKSARALMYVWFVRRWLKRRADGEEGSGFLGIVRTSSSGRGSGIVSQTGLSRENVEVRFEWKRSGKVRKGKEREGERRGRAGATGEMAGRSGGERAKEDLSHRLSVISHQSISTTVSFSDDGHSPMRRERRGGQRSGTPTKGREREQRGSLGASGDRDADLDDGEDSDPEDSETPWVCTLKIRRAGANSSTLSGSTRSRDGQRMAGASESGGRMGEDVSRPQILRIKVGTLSPTPHHPKVVGMLKVPFPLPDVEIERMGVNRRLPGQPNVRPPPSEWGGTTLTAEEIKDVVCSTGLWLVVREGFGGVGRVSRKGDGWRIRA